MARADHGRRRAPGAGAVRRLEQPVPRPGGPLADRHGREDARRSSRPIRCRASSRRSAGTHPRARPSSARASSDHVLWQEGKSSWVVALLEVAAGGERSVYFMPLALAWEERDEERLRNLSTAAVAKVRQQASVGVMGDAFADEVFCRALVKAIAERREIATGQGKLQFRPTAAFGRLAGATSNPSPSPVRRARAPTPWW